jgi:ribosomal protein L37AE/L43A
MGKKTSCPRCGSKKIKILVPQTGIWTCQKCGYQGGVVIEDGNLEKQIKSMKKMDNLSKKLMRRK